MSFAAAIIAAVGIFSGDGRVSPSTDQNLVLFAEKAPMPVIVPRGTELAAAERAAAEHRGCFAVNGAGTSMEPVYLSGTAVVVRVGGYDRLSKGQPVVYVSRTGVTVAHMLVEHTPRGWVAAGLANDAADGDLVTPDNFVGVITQAFASKRGTLPKQVSARLAARD